MKKYNIKLYIRVLVAVILVFIVFFLTPRPNHQVEEVLPQKINSEIKTQTVKPTIEKTQNIKTEENNLHFTLLAGNINTQLLFSPNSFLYDALVKERDAGKITFSGKNYPGLGFFVTDIGTLHAGSGKYLLYYINGKEATVGISSYTLKDGDIIEWKLE